MVNAFLRRQCIRFLLNMKHSVRRACMLVGMSRSSFVYQPRRRNDSTLSEQLKKIAMKFKRFGYRCSLAVLRREGQTINHKRVYRIWKLSGLSLPKKAQRKPRPGNSTLPCQASFINHVWTYDFLFDSLADGRKLKILTVIDEFSRFCLCIEVGISITSESIINILEQIFTGRRNS